MARHLQPVDGMFGPTVTEALKNVPLTDADKAAAMLARRYADAIDTAEDRDQALATFGPKLLAALGELRATPKARGALKPEPPKSGRLAALRQSRAG